MSVCSIGRTLRALDGGAMGAPSVVQMELGFSNANMHCKSGREGKEEAVSWCSAWRRRMNIVDKLVCPCWDEAVIGHVLNFM